MLRMQAGLTSSNRTSVELKLHLVSHMGIKDFSFNRTNLELKHNSESTASIFVFTFNRTSLELKQYRPEWVSDCCETF